MNSMLPQYSTVLFSEVWDNVDDFLSDYADVGIPTTISTTSATTLFYLLYGRFGNNPIANNDITQWKYKMFSVIFQYGPSWEKRLDIQSKLRNLSEDDIMKGAKAIYNTALNDSTAPSTASLEELNYINSQNTTNYKKSKMDAYTQLWNLIETDVTEEFLSQFKKCFKVFVSNEKPIIYVSENNYKLHYFISSCSYCCSRYAYSYGCLYCKS